MRVIPFSINKAIIQLSRYSTGKFNAVIKFIPRYGNLPSTTIHVTPLSYVIIYHKQIVEIQHLPITYLLTL